MAEKSSFVIESSKEQASDHLLAAINTDVYSVRSYPTVDMGPRALPQCKPVASRGMQTLFKTGDTLNSGSDLLLTSWISFLLGLSIKVCIINVILHLNWEIPRIPPQLVIQIQLLKKPRLVCSNCDSRIFKKSSAKDVLELFMFDARPHVTHTLYINCPLLWLKYSNSAILPQRQIISDFPLECEGKSLSSVTCSTSTYEKIV